MIRNSSFLTQNIANACDDVEPNFFGNSCLKRVSLGAGGGVGGWGDD